MGSLITSLGVLNDTTRTKPSFPKWFSFLTTYTSVMESCFFRHQKELFWFEFRGCPLPALKLLQTREVVLSPTLPEFFILLMIGLPPGYSIPLTIVKSAAGNWV